MENYTLEKDITILYIPADSFPQGIAEAQEKIHRLFTDEGSRKYFGVSRPNQEDIIEYKAGAEEKFPGEGKEMKCETLTIKKGKYISETIKNYNDRIESIGESFQTLLHQPGIDPEGYCVEMYIGDKDMRCIVRLKD